MDLTPLLETRRTARRLFPQLEATGGWRRSDFDARSFVDCYPPLSVKPGHSLVVYCNAWGGNCSTLLYAVRGGDAEVVTELSASPDQIDVPALLKGPVDVRPHIAWSLAAGVGPRGMIEPRPRGALASFMEAMDGDDTPLAYLQAALLARDGTELGAAWHGSVWTTHHVLPGSPFLPAERVQELAGLLTAHLRTTPIDPLDVYAPFLPGGDDPRRRHRPKRDRQEVRRESADALFQQIPWDQRKLREAISRAGSIHLNDARYYQLRGDELRLPATLADFERMPDTGPDGWTWEEPPPTAWAFVETSAREAVVTFHSWTGYLKERIFRHVSRFQRGSYSPVLEDRVVAEGRDGYIH